MSVATIVPQPAAPSQSPLPPAALAMARAGLDMLAARLGQILAGTVTGTDGHGLTQIRIGAEVIALRLTQPLPAGMAVQLTIRPGPGGQPAVTIQPVPASQPQPTTSLPARTSAPVLPSGPGAVATRPMVALPPSPLPAATGPAPTVRAAAALSGSSGASPTTAQPAPVTVAPASAAAPQTASIPVATSPSAAVPGASPSVAPTASASAALQPAALPQNQMPGLAQADTAGAAPVPSRPIAAAPTVPSGTAPTAASSGANAALPTMAAPQGVAGRAAMAASQPSAAISATAALPAGSVPPVAASGPAPTASAPYASLPPASALPAMPVGPAASTPAGAEARPVAAAPAAPAKAEMSASSLSPLSLAQPAQAAARQDSLAPLLQNLGVLQSRLASFPPPVAEAALRLLANRLPLERTAPDAATIRQAVLQASVVGEPGRPAPRGDVRSALLSLRAGLLAMLGDGEIAPVAAIGRRPPPPLREAQPRGMRTDPPTVTDTTPPREAGRTLLHQTDAALSRLKLTQLASQPPEAARAGLPAATDFTVELPLLAGHELAMAQLRVQREGKGRDPKAARGWQLRFAVSFAATGEVGAQIALLGDQAHVTLWAEREDTADALETMLPELAPALGARGLAVGSVKLRRGVPPGENPAAGRLMDAVR